MSQSKAALLSDERDRRISAARARPLPPTLINQVVNGDCLTILPKLAACSVDFVFTDPPYLSQYRDRSDRTVLNDDRNAWLRPAFAQIYRVLKPGRFCVSFYGWPKADKFLAAWKAAGFRPVGHLVWAKRYASSTRFLAYCHEQAYLLAKGNPVRPAAPIRDVLPWHYTGNRLHATQKPVPSLKPVIESFTRTGDLVLDPFCGSGSTLLAAKILHRRFVGIELDAECAKVARNRL